MLRVTPTISIDDSELEESFIASAGPGGQNVNKVATAVCSCASTWWRSRALPDPVRLRLIALSGSRTDQGRRARPDRPPISGAQERNRADVRERAH